MGILMDSCSKSITKEKELMKAITITLLFLLFRGANNHNGHGTKTDTKDTKKHNGKQHIG